MVLGLRHAVLAQRLAVVADVLARRAPLVPQQLPVREVLGAGAARKPPDGNAQILTINSLLLESNFSPLRKISQYLLHHGEVLPVVVGLEEGEAEVQLEHDAPDAPNVAGLGPAEFWKKKKNI